MKFSLTSSLDFEARSKDEALLKIITLLVSYMDDSDAVDGLDISLGDRFDGFLEFSFVSEHPSPRMMQ